MNESPEKPRLYADRPKSTEIYIPNARTMAAVSGAAGTFSQGTEPQTAGVIRTATVVESLGVNGTTVSEQDSELLLCSCWNPSLTNLRVHSPNTGWTTAHTQIEPENHLITQEHELISQSSSFLLSGASFG